MDQALVNHYRSGAISRETLDTLWDEPDQVEKLVGTADTPREAGQASSAAYRW